MHSEDAGLGALWGALAGDAAGATLEFLERPPTPEQVERAMALPGGGAHRVAPGQITDDGELTISLAEALGESSRFDLEAIARCYARWIDSSPFDVGFTTRASLGSPRDPEWRELCEREGLAACMRAAARERCMSSKANGSLMRAAPLGVWGVRLEDDADALARCAIADSSLTHPNPSCGHAVAAYVLALAHLVAHEGDRGGAFDRARRWAAGSAVDEVNAWLDDAAAQRPIDFTVQVGFVKIAFVNAFQHLLKGSSYEAALRESLLGGGDTDTNAAIVGGLLGAAAGAEGVPEAMRAALSSCDTALGRPRPGFLHPRRVPGLVAKLLP